MTRFIIRAETTYATEADDEDDAEAQHLDGDSWLVYETIESIHAAEPREEDDDGWEPS